MSLAQKSFNSRITLSHERAAANFFVVVVAALVAIWLATIWYVVMLQTRRPSTSS